MRPSEGETSREHERALALLVSDVPCTSACFEPWPACILLSSSKSEALESESGSAGKKSASELDRRGGRRRSADPIAQPASPTGFWGAAGTASLKHREQLTRVWPF